MGRSSCPPLRWSSASWTNGLTSTLGTNHPKSSLVEKALEELNTSQQCPLAAMVDNSILGCIRRSITSSPREVILPLCSALVAQIWRTASSCGLLHTRQAILERVQQMTMKMIKDWSICHTRRGYESWNWLAFTNVNSGTFTQQSVRRYLMRGGKGNKCWTLHSGIQWMGKRQWARTEKPTETLGEKQPQQQQQQQPPTKKKKTQTQKTPNKTPQNTTTHNPNFFYCECSQTLQQLAHRGFVIFILQHILRIPIGTALTSLLWPCCEQGSQIRLFPEIPSNFSHSLI